MSLKLFQHLLASYGGFADQRYKAITPNRVICIDDRCEHDRCHEFCSMFIKLSDSYDVVMHMNHLPVDDDVLTRLDKLKAEVGLLNDGNRVEFVLTPKATKHLRHLATEVRRVAGRGRHYPKRNWKWIAPRTAASLSRLAEVLERFPI